LFSTITLLPNSVLSFSASSRAMASVPPPGGKTAARRKAHQQADRLVALREAGACPGGCAGSGQPLQGAATVD